MPMATPFGERVFLERRTRSELSLRKGSTEFHETGESGVALEQESAAGVALEWEELGGAPGPIASSLSPLVDRVFTKAAPSPDLRPFEGTLREWSRLAAEHGVELDVLLRVHDQRIAAGGRDLPQFDHRHWVQLELRGRSGSGTAQKTSLRELAFGSLQELEGARERVAAAIDELSRRTRLKEQEVLAPEGPLTIVLPAGADAGVLFHEVCGHPLEGDVVLRRASYLATRMGERVAQEFVTIVDSPLEGPGAIGYRFDDEGEPATAVKLIDAGIVAGALTNRRTAGRLGTTSNGHGRRNSFRDPALPRMTHTALRPHAGTAEEILAPIERGLWVSFLTPRAVHLLPGDFSFQIVEARMIENGRLGAFVGPCVLEGNGLRALAGIEAVGADAQSFFGLKGCGKLDQGGLPVSFGNPTFRVSGLSVRSAR